MSVTHIVGVDPGLVHTGVVRLVFRPDEKAVDVAHQAIVGPDAAAVRAWAVPDPHDWPRIFIEKYQPRSHFAGDVRMVEAQANLKTRLPSAQLLLNTGVKQVVRKSLMELLGIWRFTTVTNHQDLRSAGRIALYGMLKDEELNRLLADVVRDQLKGDDWDVRH